MSFTQANRLLAIETSLGVDVLLIENFSCSERVSGLFSITAYCAVELANLSQVKPPDLIGSSVNIRLRVGETGERVWNGMVKRITQGSRDNVFAYFTLEVVPQMWRLAHMTDCRIYQGKTVPEIVEASLGELDGFKVRLDLQKKHRPWDYCVQYRESFFQFISRLLEQEGMYYFFEHKQDQHTLVISDHPNAHAQCPLNAAARYRPSVDAGTEDDDDLVTNWESADELRPGLFTMRDHHFQLPGKSLEVSESSVISMGGNSSMEVYDYPGEYAQLFAEPDKRLGEVQEEGQTLVRLRTESEEVAIRSFAGSGLAVALAAGYRFELKDHYQRSMNGKYVLTSVQHHASQSPSYVNDEPVGAAYRNSFQCIPAAVPFRPQRQTPKPFVRGVQTAVVTGPKGEEIYTDKYGRIKVQFHWDRKGQSNEKSSCWIRVATPLAGNKWGMIHIPRIGQEVVVEFLEGDPDQPIVLGSVNNADQMPPYTLPDEKTKSTIKTYSSKGGDGFNEIRLEDKKGSEQVFIHAERNYDLRVKKDRMESILGVSNLTVTKDQIEKVDGAKHLTVKGDQNEKVDGTVSLKAGADLQQEVGSNFALKAGTEVHIKSGMNLVIESGTTLTLKVGGNFINIGPAGVAIQGTMVLINSGGAAGSGAGTKPDAPKDPAEADKAQPGTMKTYGPQAIKPKKATVYGPQAVAMKNAAASGAAFCDL